MYNGVDYLACRNFLVKLESERVINSDDTLEDIFVKMIDYDSKNMITGNDLSGKNLHEYDDKDSVDNKG